MESEEMFRRGQQSQFRQISFIPRQKALLLLFLIGLLVGQTNLLFALPRQALPHPVPEAVATAQSVGRLPGNQRLKFTIGLPLRNREALTNLLEQLYDPTSTNYRHFATPAEFAKMFGPTTNDYQTLVDFARAHGLTVTRQHPNRTMLTVEGFAADIEQTFQVHLRTYQHPKEKRIFFAPDVAPSVELGIPVLGISGLNNFVAPHPMSVKPMPAKATPASGSFPGGYFIGKDFRNAYIPGVTLTGSGQVVGLLEFDDYYPSDIASYESHAGLPAVPLTNVYVDSFNGPPGDNNVEVALDIEMAISMAPGLAQVIVYEAGPNGIGDDMLNQMANNKQANQISSSWTFDIDQLTEQIFQQFAVQGQSFFNASGDDGAYSSFNRAPTPVDDPLITIVGGTTLTTSTNGAWASERVWNWYNFGSGDSGTGGGVSSFYSLPSWQQNISMVANQGSTRHRNLPDVALTADNIVVFYDHGHTEGVGGTSCAAPLWAAFAALVNQRATAAGQPTLGFINPALYAIGKSSAFLQDFHDITVGNNTNLTSATKYSAVAGYDLCTGWGTPNGANMIYALAPGLPIITSQPSNTLTLPGANVTLNVVAVGGTLSYQWFFNSNSIAGATSASFTISNAQPANAGVYAVVVSNSSGAVTSSNATLTVNTPPLITSQPMDTNVFAGGNATFVVVASGTPPPTYQWNFNGTNLALASASSLTITNAQLANQGTYSVLVSNSGGATLSSNAFLTVQSPPVILAQPNSRSVGLSNLVIFGVSAAGSSPLSYQWYFASAPIPNSTNVNIFFQHAAVSNVGNYFVVITNVYGAVTSHVATVTITNLPPSISSLPAPLNLTVGNTANFSVTASGSGALAYQWLLNSNALPVDIRISGAQTANLNISNLVLADAGLYQVIISNAFGAITSAPAVLTVSPAMPAPTFISITPNSGPATGGTSVSIIGTGFEIGATVNFGSNAATLVIVTNATNLIATTPAGNLGTVDVTLTNVDGLSFVATNAFTYTAVDTTPPLIVNNPSNQIASMGGSAAFSISANGAAPLVYQWTLNNSNLPTATNATLNFSNVLSLQAGLYQAVVSNSFGVSTSAVATLSVLGTPVYFGAGSSGIQFSNGQAVLQLSGLTGQGPIIIETSSNLINWIPIFTNPPGFGQMQFTDTNSVSNATGFYRARTLAGP